MFTEKGESVFQKGLECIQLSNPNLREAMSYFEQAAEQGHLEAQQNLAWYYYNNVTNYPEAIKWFRKAAEQGDAEAQYQLGWIYEHGEGVPPNRIAAEKWYRDAAESGHTYAQEALKDLENE